MTRREEMARRQTWKGGKDRRKEGGGEERKRRWRALKKESGYGGGWRTEWATTPKARGASRAGDENEQSVHGGRLESARDNTSIKSQKRQRRFQVEARTVNDDMKQTTRDRRGSSPVSKDR